MRTDLQPRNGRASGLVDVLDRVLDKSVVVAGDITVDRECALGEGATFTLTLPRLPRDDR
jgi:hypothetical protein